VELLFNLALFAAVVCWIVKSKRQQQRIVMLAGYLSGYSIEKNIETVTQGYLRALGESDPDRRDQVFQVLRGNEQELCRQMTQLATDFAAAEGTTTRVSKLPIWLPLPLTFSGSFDMREALKIHARGICSAIEADGATSPRDRAFAISAELFLMQHTCHWFCRSKSVASARMMARHQTSHAQLVDAVLPQTRADYLKLISR
jgi:hypothetical protein